MISMAITQRGRLLTQLVLYRERKEYYGVEVFTEVHMSADPLIEINLILHGEGSEIGFRVVLGFRLR